MRDPSIHHACESDALNHITDQMHLTEGEVRRAEYRLQRMNQMHLTEAATVNPRLEDELPALLCDGCRP